MMNDRLRKALVALMAVAAVGACGDAPVDVADDAAERLQTNPSSVAVNAGDTTFVDAFLVTALGQPILGDADFESCNTAIATVVADESQTDLEPGTRFGIVGQTVGTTCVEVTAGGFVDTVLVRVVAAAFDIQDAPDSIRAGTAGDLTITAVDAQGNPVGPFTEADATYTSSQPTRLFFTNDTGGFDTRIAGPVNVTVAWETFGIERDTVIAIVVIPSVPDSARLSAANFGAASPGDTVVRTIIVLDSILNVNRLPQDLISVTASSDNNSIATATATIEEDPARPGEVVPTIRVAAVASGSTTIDVTLTTVSETYTFNNVPITVMNPQVVSVTPPSGRPGTVVVISGTELQLAGFTTQVFMGGNNVTMFVDNITPTAITLDMPGHAANGAHEVVVSVGGVESNEGIWTQTSFSDVNAPNNEDPTTAPTVTFPIDLVGTFQGTNDNDWYRFTLAARSAMTFRLDWDRAKDLDVLFRNTANTAYVCSFGAATSAKPENATCNLNAGTYLINVNDYSNSHDGDTSPVSYELRGTATVIP